jgi:hypothetical protein
MVGGARSVNGHSQSMLILEISGYHRTLGDVTWSISMNRRPSVAAR